MHIICILRQQRLFW